MLGFNTYLVLPEPVIPIILHLLYSNNNSKIINYKNYSIDTNKRQVIENNKEINLTTLEYDLLLLFLNNKSKSFSRDEILNNVWGNNYFGSDRVVDDLVRRLRKKLPKININSIYGYGYRLNE